MKLYKFLIFLSLTQSIYIKALSDDLKEYQIEIIIFKNLENNVSETFNSELKVPDGEMLSFYTPNIKVNKKLFQEYKKESVFLEFLKGIRPFKSKIKDKDEALNVRATNPEKWFRKSSELITLNNIRNKLSTKKEYRVLDSYSWIQNISNERDAMFLSEVNIDNSFGYYLKFYKTRFMHIDFKAYLGRAKKESNYLITKSYINKFDEKMLENLEEIKSIDLDLKLNKKNEFFEINLNKKIESLERIESQILNIYIDEEKRIFNDEIHYFDHPYFGIIISVKEI
tara:strand:+ start:10572 stop:11420 length:849 start_codon:yes stop_codon:yes gene_type:complete